MAEDLSTLAAADFVPLLNQALTILFEPGVSIQGTLIEVQESENYSPAPRKPFFIVLRTEQKDRYYPQGIYTVIHPEKGEIPLFLVPLGPDSQGMRYEAVFS